MKRRIGILALIFVLSATTLIEAATQKPAPVPAPVVPTGELRIAMPSIGTEQATLWGAESHDKHYMELLFDAIVGSNADGTLSTEKGAAYKWEMTLDGLTWTFYVRKGIKFHDGSELTAEDCKFSLEQVVRRDSVASGAGRLRDTIGSMKVPDPYTLVINCRKPSPLLPGEISNNSGVEGMILPKDYTKRVGDDGFKAYPVGSGPYKFDSHTYGYKFRLQAVDKHWRDGVPKYKYLSFTIVPEESTRIAILKSGKADAVPINGENIAPLKKAGYNIFEKRCATVVGLMMHGQWANVPVADIRVRKALNLAINRQQIVDYIFPGQGTISPRYMWGSMLVQSGADPTLKPYPFDPEEAKRLLKEAGYTNLTLDMASYEREGAPGGTQMMEAIAGMWGKIGIKVKIHMTDYNAWRGRRRAQNQNGWISWSDITNTSDPGYAYRVVQTNYHSKGWGTVIKDNKVDKWIDTIAQTLNQAERAKAIGDMDRYLYEKYMMIPVVEISQFFATSPNIAKWEMGGRIFTFNLSDLLTRK